MEAASNSFTMGLKMILRVSGQTDAEAEDTRRMAMLFVMHRAYDSGKLGREAQPLR